MPLCPITGEPAAELLQRMPAKLLYDLWRYGARVDPVPLRRDSGSIGLYRSPCGLAFFHPAFQGAGSFYESLYGRMRIHEGLGAHAATRQDLGAAAALVRPGDRVLEVGCGHGAMAALLPAGAHYQGLEPYGEAPAGGPPILAETASEHAARHAGAYDLACAFQVLEHVADPLGLARDMAACLRPGGLLVVAMPIWPSALTDLPNNLVNLPPHHLTWWDEGACAALCAQLDLEPVRIAPLPPAPMEAVVFWARRLCPVRTRPGLWVKPSWRWHAAAIWALKVGDIAARVFGLPRDATPVDILLVARKRA
jgi:SAM-dependent methyltransferase